MTFGMTSNYEVIPKVIARNEWMLFKITEHEYLVTSGHLGYLSHLDDLSHNDHLSNFGHLGHFDAMSHLGSFK